MEEFRVYKNASVKVAYHTISESNIGLSICVEHEAPHVFEAGTAEARLIEQMDLKIIEEDFNGGTYVFRFGKLIDYRKNDYSGYTRSLDEINALADTLGVEVSTGDNRDRSARGMFGNFRQKSLSKDIFLGGDGKVFNLEVEGLGEGGHFENKLVHRWSPFNENVILTLETERLICENGMVGMSPFVTKEVPIVNRVQEHLDLVTVLLEPTINDVLGRRFKDMSAQPASVGSMMKGYFALSERSKGMSAGMASTSEGRESIDRSLKLKSLLDVRKNLADVYEPAVFKDTKVASSLPSNLTQFDLFNVLTEVCSHTNGANDDRIQKEINSLVFDELSHKKDVQGKIPVSSDSDHKRRFFS